MSIRKTIITTIVALTMVAVVVPGVAQGVTIEELLAQIAQLQAQLLALQGAGTGTGSTPAACAGITLSRTLVKGSTGSDVKCVQALLNTDASTQVAATGVGSPGSETTYYGNLTVAAVKKFQAKYGTGSLGTVGPLTRAKMNTMLSSGTTGGGTTGGGTTPVVPTGTGLTVALAADNPASGTVVRTQALAKLAKFTFVNGDNAEVKVTGLKLKRTGISADASASNVYLFDEAVRLTDGAAVSSTVINFNDSTGLFTVPAGGSKTVSVLADMAGSAGETMGVSVLLAGDVTTNASSVKGSFPVAGNLMNLATGTLAGAEFNATTTPAAASIDPQNDYTVWQNTVTVTTRAIDMSRISFRKTGSVKNTDLQNFRLYVDGVQTGSTIATLDANGYVTFDLSASLKRLEAGSRVIKLLADIIGGSSLNFTFNLWNSADVTLIDSQYLANVLPDLVSDAAFTKRETGQQSVNSGVITFTKTTDSPSGNIVNTASNATLAKFQVKAAGERIKIETLKVSVVVNTTAVGYLRNGMLLANGVQIGSTSNLYDTTNTSPYYTSFSLGSSLIVEPGSPVTLEVRADIFDNDGTNDITASGTASTIQVTIEGSSSENNATGMVSAATIDAPSSDVTGNSLTVAAGGLTLSKDGSYTDQTVVAPLTAYKFGDFNLTANTTEAVNITAINVTLDEISSYQSNLYVKYGTKTTSVKPSLSTALNSWSINETLAAGATIPIEVYMDANSTPTSGTATLTLDVDGTTVSSAATADSASTTTGQNVAFSSGTFTAAFASTPQNQIVSGIQSVEVARFKFTSSYQEFTIQEVKIDPDIDDNGGSDNAENIISSATLKDGSTVLATQSFNAVDTSGSTGAFYFTGLNVKVPASTSKTLTVVMEFAIPSVTADTSGLRIIPDLTYVKYINPSGSVSTISNSGGTNVANSTYVYRTVPTLTKNVLSGTTIINGAAQDLFSMKVAAPAQGDVAVKQFKVDVSWSDGGAASPADALELESLLLYKDGTNITSSVTILRPDGQDITGTTGITESSTAANNKIIVTWLAGTEDTINDGTSTTYTIRGTPQGFNITDASTAANTDSVALAFNADTADVTFGTGDSDDLDWIGFLNTDVTYTAIMRLYNVAAANASAEEAQLIWSDMSAVAHSASRTAGTGDWTNAYLLGSLTPQTWTH